jgi:predicted metal-dependent TIM-barrel fold hydrolase
MQSDPVCLLVFFFFFFFQECKDWVLQRSTHAVMIWEENSQVKKMYLSNLRVFSMSLAVGMHPNNIEKEYGLVFHSVKSLES